MMADERNCNCLHKFAEKSTAAADPEFFVVPKAMSSRLWFQIFFIFTPTWARFPF